MFFLNFAKILYYEFVYGDNMEKIKVVFLTGAGISQESGIKTFRDIVDGLWMTFPVMEVATKNGVFQNVKQAETFFNTLKLDIKQAKPNAAHLAIAELSQDPRFDVIVITQNIDDLHTKSGLRRENIFELHGNIFELVCRSHPDIYGTDFKSEKGCYHVSKHTQEDWHFPMSCPKCGKPATYSPNVVLFDEGLDGQTLASAFYHAGTADIFIQVGTSSQVYPAASIIQEVNIDKRVYIDIADQGVDDFQQYDTKLIGKATEKVVEICEKIKQKY